jgi:hypothetical protein
MPNDATQWRYNLGKDDWSAFFLYTVAEGRVDAETRGMDAPALRFLSGCFCGRAEVSLLMVRDGVVLLDFNAGILLVTTSIANITGLVSLRAAVWYAQLSRNRPPLSVCLRPTVLNRLRLATGSTRFRSSHLCRFRTCRWLCRVGSMFAKLGVGEFACPRTAGAFSPLYCDTSSLGQHSAIVFSGSSRNDIEATLNSAMAAAPASPAEAR